MKLNGFKALTNLVFIAIVLSIFGSCKHQGEENNALVRPNIIFIMSDDHAYQALSCYDGSLNQTPNIDRLAKEGLIFMNSFVCNSICAPSRASLLTGKFSHMNGQFDNRIRFDSSQLTFPRLLQESGYETAIIGKWHLKSQPTGFDYWNVLPGQGHYYNPDFIRMGKRERVEGYVTNLITDFSLEWLEIRNKEKPFCLMVHHKAPHRTWMPDSTHFSLYEPENFPLPSNYFDDYKGRLAAGEQKMSVIEDMDLVYDLKMFDEEGEIPSRYRNWYLPMLDRMNEGQRKAWDREYNEKTKAFKNADLKGEELAIWKFNRYLADYLKCIASVDDNVGRILDYLEQSGLSDNTIVVYTSDQGFYLGEHGWFDKRFMYEESLRMPLIMKLPGDSEAREIGQLVQNIDFAPTFLDLAGIKIPEEMQGVSLLPLMEGKDSEGWRESIYYHYYEYPGGGHSVKRHYGIRTERYKLIHFYDDIDSWELFDLEQDPREMNNLISDPDYTEIFEELKKSLVAAGHEYKDSIISQLH